MTVNVEQELKKAHDELFGVGVKKRKARLIDRCADCKVALYKRVHPICDDNNIERCSECHAKKHPQDADILRKWGRIK